MTEANQKLLKAIEEADKMLRQERSERLALVLEIFGEPTGMILTGGMASAFALEELQRSYIDGNFLAVILLSHVFAEQSLGSTLILSGAGRNISEGGLKKVSDKLLSDGDITESEHSLLEQLRKMRVAYTHPHEGIPERSYMKRILDAGIAPFDLLEQDAKRCLGIIADVFGLRAAKE